LNLADSPKESRMIIIKALLRLPNTDLEVLAGVLDQLKQMGVFLKNEHPEILDELVNYFTDIKQKEKIELLVQRKKFAFKKNHRSKLRIEK